MVVIDKADQMEVPKLLYDLNRIPHLHFIFIANQEEQFFAELDDRLFSRLGGGQRVHLNRYSDPEIRAILESRVDAGLALNVAPVSILEQIAALADGDARCAIEMLKVAVQTARETGHRQVTRTDVVKAETTACGTLRQKTVSKLTHHQRVFYEIQQAADEPVSMGTISDEYRHRVSNPKTRQTLRRYLKKLASYNWP